MIININSLDLLSPLIMVEYSIYIHGSSTSLYHLHLYVILDTIILIYIYKLINQKEKKEKIKIILMMILITLKCKVSNQTLKTLINKLIIPNSYILNDLYIYISIINY